MLPEYANHNLAVNENYLLYRHDLHYLDANSDKVYIVTIEQVTSAKGNPVYSVVSNWGKRGANLQSKMVGHYYDYEKALVALYDTIRKKLVKGYVEKGIYKKPAIKGLLMPAVLEELKKKYPSGATVVSPSSQEATVIELKENGDLSVMVSSTNKLHTIPFGKYGMLEVKP